MPRTFRERFDVYNALEACSQHLEQFGGHMYAAG
jgi:single-stranded-DNA-specific exonuclease